MTKPGMYDSHHLRPTSRGDWPPSTDWLVRITVTYLPLFVPLVFRGMPGMWKGHHRLILCWVVMQALFPGRKTLAELSRWTPPQITARRLRRVVHAAYWDVHVLVAWWVQEALNILPPPKTASSSLGGDGSEQPKRGKKNPLAQQGRKGQNKRDIYSLKKQIPVFQVLSCLEV